MSEMVYAPMVMITLCRSAHFIRAIESLKRNTWAHHTEVFIGLDYPAKPAHEKGYQEICEYLSSGDFSVFANFTVLKHDHNVGAQENYRVLREKISPKYDRWIGAEDDIEFSPLFIEYMDKALQRYKDDPRVIAVSGYSYPIDWSVAEGASAFLQSGIFSTWGTGYWRDKDDQNRTTLMAGYLKRNLKRAYRENLLDDMIAGRRVEYLTFCALGCGKGLLDKMCDMSLGIYLALARKKVVNPIVSMTRNHGFDGSGMYCEAVREHGGHHSQDYDYDNQPLYEGSSFELVVDEDAAREAENRRRLDAFIWVDPKMTKLARFSDVIIRRFGVAGCRCASALYGAARSAKRACSKAMR